MLIIIIRTVIVYLLIVFSLRLMGKKQLSELQPSELVTTIMISNIATLSLEDSSSPMLMGIVPILMIACLDVFMSGVVMKSGRVRKIVSGSPCVVISDGKIDQRMMKNLRYTVDDLAESMREQGIFDISQVQYAIVETTGKINFMQKETPAENPPQILIKDGEISTDALAKSKLGDGWLRQILRENRIEQGRVFILSADDNGNYIIVPREYDKKTEKEKAK